VDDVLNYSATRMKPLYPWEVRQSQNQVQQQEQLQRLQQEAYERYLQDKVLGGQQQQQQPSQKQQQRQQQQEQGRSPPRLAGGSSSPQQQFEYVPEELLVRLTLDELRQLREERLLWEQSLEPHFLRKGTGHLAYTPRGSRRGDDMFVTSSGPYRDPVQVFKDENRSKWLAGEFRLTGFEKLQRREEYLNKGPWRSGNAETIKLLLRTDAEWPAAGPGAAVLRSSHLGRPHSASAANGQQSPPRWNGTAKSTSSKSQVDKLVPLGYHGVHGSG
jgi:hypothetical protein